MSGELPSIDSRGLSLRWMARVLSIATWGTYLIIIALAISNEDRPEGMAILVLALLVLTLVATLVAWRWEEVGGLAVIVLAVFLAIASSSNLQFSSLSLLPALVLSGPFLIVGIMFWVSGRQKVSA